MRRSAEVLQRRIVSRFPDRGLWEVCGEVVALVDEVNAGSGISRRRVRLARLLSRIAMLVVVAFLGGAVTLAAIDVAETPGALAPVDLLPLIETIINDLVFGRSPCSSCSRCPNGWSGHGFCGSCTGCAPSPT